MRFLYNAPAVLHKGAIIIGDTHFGMEKKLMGKGIRYSEFSVRLAASIIELMRTNRAKRLIMLGDVKEDVTYLDEFTIRAFDMLAKEKFRTTVVRGNHDGGIENLGKSIDVVPSEGFVYEGLGLVHGHSWPAPECMGAQYLLSAHQHPQLEIIDSSGKRHVEQVWAVADANPSAIKNHYEKFNEKIKLILLPAFNPLVGNPLKKASESRFGPIFNNKLFKWNDALLYRLNGVAVGSLSKVLGWPDG